MIPTVPRRNLEVIALEDRDANDPVIADYYSLKPFTFHDVERLEIRQPSPEEGSTTSLEMEVRHADPEDKRRLFLTFNGVLNLRLTPPQGAVLCLSQLEVYSIKDRQWEGVNFSVKDVEEDTISFLCHDFAARVG